MGQIPADGGNHLRLDPETVESVSAAAVYANAELTKVLAKVAGARLEESDFGDSEVVAACVRFLESWLLRAEPIRSGVENFAVQMRQGIAEVEHSDRRASAEIKDMAIESASVSQLELTERVSTAVPLPSGGASI